MRPSTAMPGEAGPLPWTESAIAVTRRVFPRAAEPRAQLFGLGTVLANLRFLTRVGVVERRPDPGGVDLYVAPRAIGHDEARGLLGHHQGDQSHV